ncbi:Methenyltetrahydrofolate cyclohydrolase [Thermotoga petrophila RKU-1]|uniref:Bifunctional protein FolD n=1 Tax=Thermotoga petrophila (strain ATCC BAA-488 / DSM 13995 / JCM 10881 / RKU-1) TaxID=390874 RepID=FOLD_THEP1|nr:bifunctional 5,10-methylenetetrahydrofolate dehydrogenase/5,10-methenyltetrahydrofolate cyclohydrolase [Thermotoga petrophila]A5ILJ9.1 RecName: Full=Bifunctional protein FolD; Includes: RecName: Full=Methylenetetrahydrofolate dehydrogenase; Includes: RecName: Full=Methenyltetrahydrofolate cyclohydrolase [Thermotoga petrophila RKU-1]ABQ47072.1 Methenyltetrahydrofolate cyclohydrolase [Thermotoga petrophila RKU-1]
MWIDCRTIARSIEERTKERVEKLGFTPKLVSVACTDDPSTLSYLKSQRKKAEKLGIAFEILNVSPEEIVSTLKKLGSDESVNGVFVARPFPPSFDEKEILSSVPVEKDVEGVNPANLGLLLYDEEIFPPCTAEAAVRILERETNLSGKRVTVVGRSVTVGKPLALMLLKKGRDATVTVCHSRTVNLEEITKNSDIVVVAVGRAHFLKKNMVKEGAIVIDVGINYVDGKLQGDVDPSVEEIARVTPVPGGVGQVTTALLFEHVVRAAERQRK